MNDPSGIVIQCRECGAVLSGRYCSECGQDSHRQLRSVRNALTRAVVELADLDGPLFRTFKRLLLQPGTLVRDYSEGRFKGQVPPLRLYVLASAGYFFFAPLFGGGVVTLGESGGYFILGPLGWHSELLFLALVPVWGVVVWLSLLGQGRYYEEAFVFSVHYHVFFLVWMVILAGVSWAFVLMGLPAAAVLILSLGMAVPAVYLHSALHGAFGFAQPRRIFSAAVLFFAQVTVGQVLFNLLESGW